LIHKKDIRKQRINIEDSSKCFKIRNNFGEMWKRNVSRIFKKDFEVFLIVLL
jgi:hypothetical protein